MFFDPMWFLFAAPAILLALYAQMKVSKAYSKYSKLANSYGLTGAEVARRLLEMNSLYDVKIEGVPGQLTDHYDPRSKVLRLSDGVYRSPSVAALGIVAHEVGHAVQDKTGYAALRLRSGLVPMANLGSWLGYIFFILGLFIQRAGLVWLGVLFFSLAVAFALVTLPVEWDASRRAKLMLSNTGLASTAELEATNAVLSAAALTYLAALLQAVGQLLYFVFYALGMGRQDE